MHIKILLILLLILSEYETAISNKGFKNMLNKAKTYYKSKFGKNKTWNYLGYDSSEYPGTNEDNRKINMQKWNEYYECLNIQNNNLGAHQTITPEALQAYEGGSVSLDCKICLNPKERAKIDAVEWYWAPLTYRKLIPVEYTEHILISPEDKTLSLYNLKEEQTGQYICKLGTSLTAPYFLTVLNSVTNISEVHTEMAQQGPYSRKSELISDYALVLDTTWGEWSLCSACGKIGKRHKFGYCMVMLQNNPLPMRRADIQLGKVNTNPDVIMKKDLQLLQIFKNGIPCSSHLLPESIKNISQIKNRRNEIMTSFCKVSCSEDKLFVVQDKNGHVIETANNSAGIYSMLQGIPAVEPAVERMLQYERMGENVVLTCPGNLNTDMPIQWQIGSKKLIADLIGIQSQGRIYISVMDRIYIKKAKLSDSNIYSCWQNNDLAGTIRLVVEKKIKMTFNHHIMLLGVIIILSVFLYIFTKAFFGRKYAVIPK